MKLKNRVAIVTGAGQGLGEAIATRFAQEGADIVVADMNLETAQETAKEITSMGRKSLAIQADVANSSDVKNVVNKTVEEFAKIDILVNNAGVRPVTAFLDKTEEEWNRTLGVNLFSQFFFIKEVTPHMIKAGKGKIVNIASVAAFKTVRNRVDYCVTKAGIAMLTKCAALELGPTILVNAIAPGVILTPMTAPYFKGDTLDSKAIQAELETSAIPKVGKPEDVANMALFLVSDESDFCTGGLFIVDGGYTLE